MGLSFRSVPVPFLTTGTKGDKSVAQVSSKKDDEPGKVASVVCLCEEGGTGRGQGVGSGRVRSRWPVHGLQTSDPLQSLLRGSGQWWGGGGEAGGERSSPAVVATSEIYSVEPRQLNERPGSPANGG
ncbi:hypothetical protein Pmani_036464 [Petrolisthes manimaculis]|uniref:Uncharacterized protein n=1 Tax=Petrolisthes manimaculis TaxID=1843537 RepID=A0AAE1NJ99_9EUCA|nr:hypothetical protein Pmani_036464 [Petrolisthes manimaculis]